LRFDLPSFLATHLKVKNGPREYQGGQKWELAECPFNPEHTNGSAVIMRSADGVIGFKCQHNSCADRHWRDVREKFAGPPNGNRSDQPPALIRSIEEIPLISEMETRPISYLLPPVLPEAAVVGITGDSGSGKSTLVLAWAGEVSAQRQVLILDRENPLPIVAERLHRLGVCDGPALHIWGGWLPEEAPVPGSTIVFEWASRCEPRPLIVVDSLVAFLRADENSATEVRMFLHQCRKLADLGCTVVLIHHTGKAATSKDYRGSSDIKAALDAAFAVTNTSSDGLLGEIRLRCFKSRYGFSGDVLLRYMNGRFVQEDGSTVLQPGVEERLVSLLRTHPGIQTAAFEQLASKAGLGRDPARQFLYNGVLAGSVRREPGKNNSKRYSLVEVPSGEE
jgi:energy-coupling factor transporter ATP-binding protein EcfA2